MKKLDSREFRTRGLVNEEVNGNLDNLTSQQASQRMAEDSGMEI